MRYINFCILDKKALVEMILHQRNIYKRFYFSNKMFRETCLVCSSHSVVDIINLGMHPFADSFIPAQKISEPDLVYPLICCLCASCGHVQTKCPTDPHARYSGIEYSYTSSNSSFTRTHWDSYAQEVSHELQLKPNSFIVEIGSNDGYLSEQFLKKGHRVIGVDPSPHMAELAKQRNIKTIISLFGNETAQQIISTNGKADLVVANNVFNHADSLFDFTQAVSNILAPGGIFVSEQPYWLELMKSGKFDQIYHEHVNYFSVKALSKLFDRVGMAIIAIKIVDFHGKSFRVFAQKKEDIKNPSPQITQMIQEEEKYGLFTQEFYKAFMQKNILQRSRFMQKIHKIKESGEPIVAIAAAAKGNTFLNFYKLDSTIIDYVTDASPHKKGKYMPATRIPIVGDEIFSKYGKVYALILTGNLPEKIKDILRGLNPQIEFLEL